MPELRCKSIRMDIEYTAADYDELWSWAPERNIKIKAVSWSIDCPNARGTFWNWLSKGAVGITTPEPGPNEEEMIISAIHCRSETPGGIEATNVTLFADFGANYMEVEDGEKLYVLGRGPTGMKNGVTVCIYYL